MDYLNWLNMRYSTVVPLQLSLRNIWDMLYLLQLSTSLHSPYTNV